MKAMALSACAFITLAVLTGCAGGDSTASQGFTAEVMCEDFVKDRLKSPGSAEFDEQEHSGTHPSYTVTGVVDSQNSFGAMVRNEYRCEIRKSGEDEWTLVDLQMTSN